MAALSPKAEGEKGRGPGRRTALRRRPDQLPGGHHGLDRETVVASQRSRILNAMVQTAGQEGYGDTRIAEVIARAGVSRKAFYEHFEDKEECFVAAYEHALTPLLNLTLQAFESQDGWANRLRAGLAALLNALAQDPPVARVCFVEVMAAGPKAVVRRNQAMRTLTEVFASTTGAEDDQARKLPPVALLSLLGGLAEILYQEISNGAAANLPELLPDLMYTAVLPILGPEAAERELKRGRRGRPARS
jgi:AcrR family transcriptional regulator